MTEPTDTLVIVLRAWREEGTDEQLRVRLMHSELPSDDQESRVATGIDDTLSAIRQWLEGFVAK